MAEAPMEASRPEDGSAAAAVAASSTADTGLAQVALGVAEALEGGRIRSKADLHLVKQRLTGQAGLRAVPRDADLLPHLTDDIRRRFGPLLRKKPARSGSGVAIVAVMSSPAACPHGKCVYCPGGPDVDAPQSYTGFEPSTMRAKRFGYDPYRIVRHRLGVLEANGHAVDKVEIVIQGGTFPARDEAYRDWTVAGVYAACNDGPDAAGPAGFVPLDVWSLWAPDSRAAVLDGAMAANETARCRVVGLTIETKPDWCLEEHVDAMLRYGTTRVEIGIQTLDEGVTRLTNRGHTVQDAADALRIARDAGLKVCAHLMPGLPRPDPDRPGHYRTDSAADLEDVRRLFDEEDWRPDMLKIYPTLVVQEGDTVLKRWWQEGRYAPLTTEEASAAVAEALGLVPAWCRIQRVDRDIPTTHVLAGVEKSNLRQLAEGEAARRGIRVREVRAREAHRRFRDGVEVDPDRVVLVRRDYEASGGTETFLSFEDPVADAVIGYLRLRRVGPTPHRAELRDPRGTAIVRELKVYGTAQALGDHDAPDHGVWQHQGYGARLLAEAERVANAEWHVGRIAVLAGVGVKGYYRRHGYDDLGPYVTKTVSP